MIDFNGTTYKTSLRAPTPNAQKTYFFDMKEMKTKGYLPKTVSVSPVFIRDNRQILGEITSYVNLPILNIVKSYTDILIELKADDVAVVNVTEANKTISNLCDSYVGEDPWGGCPIATGSIYSVYFENPASYFDFVENAGSWNGKGIKFKGDNCVIKNNSCTTIAASMTDESWWANSLGSGAGIISLNDKTLLNQTTQKCMGNNWFYVYNGPDCL